MKGTVHSATPPTGASLPTRWLGRARWAGGRELLLNRWWSAVRPSDRSCATGWDQVWARARFGTQGPTLASLELLHRLGAERGLDVAEWLCSDAEETPLEACQADWRPVIRERASDPLRVPSRSLLSIGTLIRWSGPGGHALSTALIGCRFSYGRYGRASGGPRRIMFSIDAGAVKRLLAYRVPDHPPCGGVAGRCAVCVAFLHGWRNCLAGGTATLICPRGAEVAELQTCDLWQRFDERAGYTRSGAGQQSTSRSSIRSTYCGCRAGTHKMWPRGAKSSLAAQPCSTRPGRPSTFELILCTVPCYKGMASWAGAGRQPRDTGLPDLGRPAT